MAKKPAGEKEPEGTRTIIDKVPIPRGELSPEDRRSDEQQAEFDRFMEEVGPEGAKIKLYRVVATGGYAYCETVPCPPDVEEYITATWGGGRYQVRLRSKENQPLGTKTITIEGAPKNPRTPDGAPVAPHADPGALSDVAKLLIQMADKRADDANALLRTVLETRNAAPATGTGIADIIGAVKEVMAMGRVVDPREQMKQMGEAMKEGMALGQEMRGGGARKTEWADVVKDALPAIGEVARAMSATAQRPAQPPRRVAPGPPAQVVGSIPPAPGTETADAVVDAPPVDRANVPPWLLAVEPYLPLLVAMAHGGMNPEATADQILEKLPDDVFNALEADARVDGWIGRTLAVLPPQLSQAHAGWTTMVLTAIQAAVLEPPGDDVPEVPA